MLEAAQPLGANGTDDPTVARQRIIDRAMDLVPPAEALTSQDEAALARLRAFISTVAGAMWDATGTERGALGTDVNARGG